MPVSELTYECVALEDPERHWELDEGLLRSKPDMSFEHNDIIATLGTELARQLNRSEFRVRINSTRVRQSARSFYIPDVLVVPTAATREKVGQPGRLEFYELPLPLVVEVWSPSTGGYDVDDKLPKYQQRGDLEIWRIHPYERTLTRWQRQADGTYAESQVTGGIVEPVALPGVRIDLDELFRF